MPARQELSGAAGSRPAPRATAYGAAGASADAKDRSGAAVGAAPTYDGAEPGALERRAFLYAQRHLAAWRSAVRP